MAASVLLIDSDAKAGANLTRFLQGRFDVKVVAGGRKAIEAIDARGPVDVLIADVHLEDMNAAALLDAVRKKSPATIRVMTSRASDTEESLAALSRAGVFWFLKKPLVTTELVSVLTAAARQHDRYAVERRQFEDTLTGSLKTMSEMLAAVAPRSFARATRIQELVRPLAEKLGEAALWDLEMAALFARIGEVSVPPEVSAKVVAGAELTDVERTMVGRVPAVGSQFLKNIPRLAAAGRLVGLQNVSYYGGPGGGGPPSDAELPLAARILKVASDYVDAELRSVRASEAVEMLNLRNGEYDPRVLAALVEVVADRKVRPLSGGVARTVDIANLRVGHILGANIVTTDGTVVLTAGERLTAPVIESVRRFAAIATLANTIVVLNGRATDPLFVDMIISTPADQPDEAPPAPPA